MRSPRGRSGVVGGVLLLAAALVVPWLGGGAYVAHLMVLGSLTALLAVGLDIALGLAGLFSFAQGAFYGLGAYTSALLTLSGVTSTWLGLVAAGVVAGVAGLGLGLFTIRLGGHYLAIATFAFQEIVILIIRNWDSLTRGNGGLTGVPGPTPLSLPGLPALAFTTERQYYYLTLAVLVGAVLVSARLRRSQIGLELLALRDDETAARAMGVRTLRLKLFAFTASAVLAGMAGSLFAHYVKNVSPDSFELATSFTVLVSVLVGGIGTTLGPVLGGFVLTFLPEYLRAFASQRYTIYGVLLIVVIIAMPTGVAGALRGLARRGARGSAA